MKGRDFYDFVWHLGRAIPCDVAHLQQRMEQTGHRDPSETLDLPALKDRLRGRFQAIDFEQAKVDVRPFIRDDAELDLWGNEFFSELADRITESDSQSGRI